MFPLSNWANTSWPAVVLVRASSNYAVRSVGRADAIRVSPTEAARVAYAVESILWIGAIRICEAFRILASSIAHAAKMVGGAILRQ